MIGSCDGGGGGGESGGAEMLRTGMTLVEPAGGMKPPKSGWCREVGEAVGNAEGRDV